MERGLSEGIGSYDHGDCELAGWRRPRRPSGVVSVQRLAGLQLKERRYFSLSLRTGKSGCPRSKAARQEEFSLIFGRVGLLCSLQAFN